jgi:hypothetical protein
VLVVRRTVRASPEELWEKEMGSLSFGMFWGVGRPESRRSRYRR